MEPIARHSTQDSHPIEMKGRVVIQEGQVVLGGVVVMGEEEEMGVVMTGEITMVAMAHLGTTTKVVGDGMGLPTRMTTLTTPDHPNRPMRIVSSQNALNY